MGGSAAREASAMPHFVGRYEVLVPIASGGMATVYLARSRGAGGFEREVALKLTHLHLRESPDFQSLLIEEAKLASAIRHNHVVSVLDVGDDPLGLFLVMDYVEGDTLSGLLRRGRTSGEPMPRGLAMRALLDALAGLHAAHETKDVEGKPLHIVHRDFSPQNILVGTDGIAKLTDFGIAKAASRAGNTSTGVLKGKIAYMSPEQARGNALDRRADVWAAGVLAWEIVAGRALWSRESEDVATLIKLVTTPPPRLREIDPTVSEALDGAIAKALAMEPAERWPTAAALSKALAGAIDVATTEELAAYVSAAASTKLEQRREQIRSMGALRAKMGEITEASVMTPSGAYVHAIGEKAAKRASEPEPDPESEAATEVVEPPKPSAPPAREPEVLDILPRKSPPKWAVPVVAGFVGVSLLVVVIAAVTHKSDTPTPASTTVTTATETAATQQTVAIPPATTSAPIAPATTTALVPTVTATATAIATHAPTTHPTTHAAPTTTKLAPSPY
jgi:serine/threonine-protein kinase